MSRRLRSRGGRRRADGEALLKSEVVRVTRQEMQRIDHYIAVKEAARGDARPSDEYLRDSDVCEQAESLKTRLRGLPSGPSTANEYQKLCLEILNFLFNPELIDGRMEVRTIDGTERRDIIFTNDSDETFWSYVRQEHSAFLLLFEAKNKKAADNQDLAQVATYLGDRLGRLGIVLTRDSPSEPQRRKAFSIYNDSDPRKVILFVTDEDLARMMDMRCASISPMRHIQSLYRDFRTTVQ